MVFTLPTVCLFAFILGQSLSFASIASLTTPSSTVNEGDSLTLTCSYTGSDALTVIAWYIVDGEVDGINDENVGNILFVTSPCSGTVNTTLYEYTCISQSVVWTIKSIQQSQDNEVWGCSATASTVAYSGKITINIKGTCTCDNKDAICECKAGMIVFTVVNYVLDIVYFGIIVWLTLGIRALAKCAPQGKLNGIIIGCATNATIFLDIGLTINLFLNVESAEECCCTNGSKCGHGLRVALAVLGWLFSCAGFGLLIRHIAKGGCGGQNDLPPINDEPNKPKATVSPTLKPAQKGTGHALGDMKNTDVAENGSKGGRPQPIPPREDSASEVSRKDVDIEVTRRPLPPVGGGMGQRGLSANFGNDGDLTPADGAPSNRLPPMQHITENDETEKKKKKKKKKRKEAETNEEEDEE